MLRLLGHPVSTNQISFNVFLNIGSIFFLSLANTEVRLVQGLYSVHQFYLSGVDCWTACSNAWASARLSPVSRGPGAVKRESAVYSTYYSTLMLSFSVALVKETVRQFLSRFDCGTACSHDWASARPSPAARPGWPGSRASSR